MSQRLFHLGERPHFDLDRLRTAAIAVGTLKCRHDATRERNVIVLDEHAVGEIKTMILPASAAHAVLVNDSQAGHRLARIENSRLCPAHRFDELPRDGGYPAHALQEIQNHTLAGKYHPRIVPDDRHGLAWVQAHAVKHFWVARDFVMRDYSTVEGREYIENGRNYAQTRKNAILFRDDGGRRPLIRINASVAGGIARRPVFEQCVFEDGGNAAAVEVHKVRSQVTGRGC